MSITKPLTRLLPFVAISLYVQAKISPEVDAILESYCYSCHDDDVQKGDVDLFTFTELDADARLELLNRIEEQIYLSQMPPKEKKQPTAAEKERLLAWVSQSFASLRSKSEFREKLHEPPFGNYVRLPGYGQPGHKTLGNWYTTHLNNHGNPIEHYGQFDQELNQYGIDQAGPVKEFMV